MSEHGFKRPEVDTERLPDALINKWTGELMSEGFVPFPKKLLRSLSSAMPGCTLEHLQVILAIADYKRPNLRQPPSLAYLAYLAGMDESAFRQRLKELQAMGLVEREGPDEVMLIDIRGLIDTTKKLTKA